MQKSLLSIQAKLFSAQVFKQFGTALFHAWFPQRCLLCLSQCMGDFCKACQPLLDAGDEQRGLRCPRCGLLPGTKHFRVTMSPDPVHGCEHQTAPWHQLWIGMDYQFPMDGLLMLGKFLRDANACRALGRWLAGRLAAGDGKRTDAVPWVIPMPSTPSRLQQRGYNPVEQIARGWRSQASCLGLAPPIVVCDLLLREENGPSQSLRKASERRLKHELRKASSMPQVLSQAGFYLDARKLAALGAPSRVVLLDDVMTTGTTLRAACGVLNQAGLQSVDIVVLMRR